MQVICTEYKRNAQKTTCHAEYLQASLVGERQKLIAGKLANVTGQLVIQVARHTESPSLASASRAIALGSWREGCEQAPSLLLFGFDDVAFETHDRLTSAGNRIRKWELVGHLTGGGLICKPQTLTPV